MRRGFWILGLLLAAPAGAAELPCVPAGTLARPALRWRAPSNAVAAGVTEYRLYRSRTSAVYGTDYDALVPLAASADAVLALPGPELDPTARWHFVLRAVGPGGASEPSNEVAWGPVARVCPAPLPPELLPILERLESAVQDLRALTIR